METTPLSIESLILITSAVLCDADLCDADVVCLGGGSQSRHLVKLNRRADAAVRMAAFTIAAFNSRNVGRLLRFLEATGSFERRFTFLVRKLL